MKITDFRRIGFFVGIDKEIQCRFIGAGIFVVIRNVFQEVQHRVSDLWFCDLVADGEDA